MKRYRRAFNPVLLKHKIEKVIMSEDEEGIWVKYEDTLKALQEFAKGIGYILTEKEAEEWLEE